MTKEKFARESISFRPAKPEDAKLASRLLFETFPQKATFIIGLGDADRAKRILRNLFEKPDHRLSYSVTHVVLHQGRIVGLLTAFPGWRLGHLDRRLDFAILRQYSLRGKLAVFSRGWPMIFIKEATRKEYYLSNLAVRKRYRSRGLGEHMLAYIETRARETDLDMVSLMVAIENERAKAFYERHGFKTTAIHLESNHRVAHLGVGYQRMIKELNR
jgi:ribosomal protein S18 acetylase RimI-like enzyme